MVLLYAINFLLYFDFNKAEFLEKITGGGKCKFVGVHRKRPCDVMFCEFGVGLSKAYLRLPQTLR